MMTEDPYVLVLLARFISRLLYQTLWYNAQYHIRKCQDYVYVKGEYYVMNKALFETWK